MSTPVEIVAEADGMRAVILSDDYPERPDGCGYGGVIRVGWNRGDTRFGASVEYADCGLNESETHDDHAARRVAEAFADRLNEAARFVDDWRDVAELIGRRMGLDVHEISTYAVRHDDVFVMIVGNGYSAKESAHDWQAWLDGDVYSIAVERRVEWHSIPVGCASRESWEPLDSVSGFYGREYAEQSAREMFADYTEPAVS